MRPKPYNPAKRSTPQYWRHGFIWADGVKYGVWHIGAKSAQRAKKGNRVELTKNTWQREK